MLRYLRRTQTVNCSGVTGSVYLGIDIRVCRSGRQVFDKMAEVKLRINLDAFGLNGVKILSLTIGRTRGDKSNTRECAWPGGKCHIGNGIIQFVIKGGNSDGNSIALQVQSEFRTLHPFRFQQSVSRSCVVTDAKWPEQFVQCWQAPAEISRPAHCKLARRIVSKAAARGKFGAVTIIKFLIRPHGAGERIDKLDLAQ